MSEWENPMQNLYVRMGVTLAHNNLISFRMKTSYRRWSKFSMKYVSSVHGKKRLKKNHQLEVGAAGVAQDLANDYLA